MAQDTADQIQALRELLKSPQRRQREHEQAYAELGPGFVQRPISDIESQIPINRAMGIASTEGRLAAIVDLARMTQMSRGGIGPLSLPNIRGMATNLARKRQDVPDLEQVGNTAMLSRIQSQGATGPEAFRTARGAIRNYQKGQTGGLGAREQDVRLLDAARARLGDVGELRLLGEIRKTDPSFTLDKLRHVRGNLRQPDLRLDAPSQSRPDETVGQGLRGLAENPAQRAELKEALAKLSPGEQKALLSRIEGAGRGVDTKSANRALKKLGYDEPKPISGGAIRGPEDAPTEFAASQFRPELQRQPGFQFGQEGPTAFKDLLLANPRGQLASGKPLAGLPKKIMESEYLMATSGGGNRVSPAPVLSQQNPIKEGFEWDKLRGIFKNLGFFQGRN